MYLFCSLSNQAPQILDHTSRTSELGALKFAAIALQLRDHPIFGNLETLQSQALAISFQDVEQARQDGMSERAPPLIGPRDAIANFMSA